MELYDNINSAENSRCSCGSLLNVGFVTEMILPRLSQAATTASMVLLREG